MKADTVVELGAFKFSGFEVPDKIPFGGDQQAVVHKLVGGARQVDAMGRDDAPLEWSGIFRGDSAQLRALYLDGLRIAGKQQQLRWYGFDFTVIVKTFHADFERFYHIPYKISCLVVADNASPITTIIAPDVDTLIGDDMAAANTLGGAIGDGPLSTALGALNTAIKSVSSFATAANGAVQSVLQPLAAVQSRVNILIGSVGGVVGNIGTFGGMLPGNSISQQANKMLGQVAVMNQLPQLYNLQSTLGRMGKNLGQ